MKKVILMAVLVAFASIVFGQQDTSMSVREVRDPLMLKSWLEANASDAETRLATVEGLSGRVTLRDASNPDRLILREQDDGANFVTLKPADTLTGDRVVLMPDADVTLADIATAVQQTTTLTAGNGLSGGGDLTENRTIDLSADALARIVAADVAEAAQSVTLRGDATIQIVNPEGDSIAAQHLVRVWFGTEAFGAPCATDNTVAIETGTEIQAVLADAHYLILTDAAGAAEVHVTIDTDGSRFVMVEVGGKVTSTELTIDTIGG